MKDNASVAICLALAVLLCACGSAADADKSDAAAASTEIELVGTWTDEFGTVVTITATDWNGKSKDYEFESKIVQYDNAENWAVTRNSIDEKHNADKFDKQVWTEPKAGIFHHCTVVFGLDSVELAKASTATADTNDLQGKGCGGFPWTKLTGK